MVKIALCVNNNTLTEKPISLRGFLLPLQFPKLKDTIAIKNLDLLL